MTRDDIALMYEYDRWANARVIDAAAALAPEQFTKDLGGSFSSVRDTLLHILAGEWIWLNLWKHPSPDAEFLVNLRTRRESVFAPTGFPDISSVESKWAEIERDQTDFLSGLTDADLEKMFPSRGGELRLVRLMQHLANHSTYHRGQISLMMRQLQAKPAPTDFHLFLTERGDAQA